MENQQEPCFKIPRAAAPYTIYSKDGDAQYLASLDQSGTRINIERLQTNSWDKLEASRMTSASLPLELIGNTPPRVQWMKMLSVATSKQEPTQFDALTDSNCTDFPLGNLQDKNVFNQLASRPSQQAARLLLVMMLSEIGVVVYQLDEDYQECRVLGVLGLGQIQTAGSEVTNPFEEGTFASTDEETTTQTSSSSHSIDVLNPLVVENSVGQPALGILVVNRDSYKVQVLEAMLPSGSQPKAVGIKAKLISECSYLNILSFEQVTSSMIALLIKVYTPSVEAQASSKVNVVLWNLTNNSQVFKLSEEDQPSVEASSELVFSANQLVFLAAQNQSLMIYKVGASMETEPLVSATKIDSTDLILGHNEANNRFEAETSKDQLFLAPSLFDSIYFLAVNATALIFYLPNGRVLDRMKAQGTISSFFKQNETVFCICGQLSSAEPLACLEVASKGDIKDKLVARKTKTEKKFGRTIADSEFTDLERDLEDQISELILEQMDLTMNTHLSQYTNQQEQLSILQNIKPDVANDDSKLDKQGRAGWKQVSPAPVQKKDFDPLMSSQKKLEDEIIREFGGETPSVFKEKDESEAGEQEGKSVGGGDILQEMFDRHQANTEAQKKFDDMVRLQKLQNDLPLISEDQEGNPEKYEDVFQESFQKSEVLTTLDQHPQETSTGLDIHQDLVVTDPKSIYVQCESKIESNSIYDNQATIKNKTRFGPLPTKLQKKNLPVTFHKKIKSSGYSAAPGSLKYTSKERQKAASKQTGVQWTVSQDFFSKPLAQTIPEELQVMAKQPFSKNALTKVKYSPSGIKLAAASQDTMITVMKTPAYANSLEVTTLQGHNGGINSLSWSSDDQYLLSASADKSCILWNLNWAKKGEKLLHLDRFFKTKQGQTLARQPSAGLGAGSSLRASGAKKASMAAGTSAGGNNPFQEQIRCAQFFNKDKLIVLASGNKLLFYQYELPSHTDNGADDVKRLQQRGLYKLIQQFEHTNAQHIPTFTLHNSRTQSHIGILGGSNKELVVVDVNTNKPISVLLDTHYKHIHTVKFYEGHYSLGDRESLNTFLTASQDNTVKLWDLRVGDARRIPVPVRQFSGGNQNRAMQIGFEVSGCYRYLVTGSECRSAFTYDIGSGQLVEKTKNSIHGDAVTDVSFNPVYNEWATSSIDGHCRVFRYPAYKIKSATRHNPGGGLQVKGQKMRVELPSVEAMASQAADDIVKQYEAELA